MIKNFVDKIADRIRMGYLAAFLLLLISYVLTFSSTQKLINQANFVNHTSEVIHQLDNLIASITRAESDFRGYFGGRNKFLLNDYYRSRNTTDSLLNAVKKLTGDNTARQSNIDSLSKLIKQKFILMDNGISIIDSKHALSNSVLIDNNTQGLIIMRHLEDYIHKSNNHSHYCCR